MVQSVVWRTYWLGGWGEGSSTTMATTTTTQTRLQKAVRFYRAARKTAARPHRHAPVNYLWGRGLSATTTTTTRRRRRQRDSKKPLCSAEASRPKTEKLFNFWWKITIVRDNQAVASVRWANPGQRHRCQNAQWSTTGPLVVFLTMFNSGDHFFCTTITMRASDNKEDGNVTYTGRSPQLKQRGLKQNFLLATKAKIIRCRVAGVKSEKEVRLRGRGWQRVSWGDTSMGITRVLTCKPVKGGKEWRAEEGFLYSSITTQFLPMQHVISFEASWLSGFVALQVLRMSRNRWSQVLTTFCSADPSWAF